MTTELTEIILQNLQSNVDYLKKVSPYLKKDYFKTDGEKQYFSAVLDFYNRYKACPTAQTLSIYFNSLKIVEAVYDEIMKLHDKLWKPFEKSEEKWLIDITEQFCKDRALELALLESFSIIEGQSKKLSKTHIPELLRQALNISFDTTLGHDYLADAASRYTYYTEKVDKLPFFLDMFNKITGGGILRKTCNAVVAGTGVGKSNFLCNLAANYVQNGFNVVYFTMEMGEQEIPRRIDANLMDIPIGGIDKIPQDVWDKKVQSISSLVKNKLIIKEFPSGGAHAGHFRFFLDELENKKGFKADIIIVDYLNICASEKYSKDIKTYEKLREISIELRGLAMEKNAAVWTALQFNREGMNNSDPDADKVASSIDITHNLDFLFGLVRTEELAQMGQVMVKQFKSRYGDINWYNRFVIGYDKDKMRFYDANQPNLTPSTPTPSFTSNNNKPKPFTP